MIKDVLKKFRKIDISDFLKEGGMPQMGDKIQYGKYKYEVKSFNSVAKTIETKRGLTLSVYDCQIFLEEKN